jgi:hypothetical protein
MIRTGARTRFLLQAQRHEQEVQLFRLRQEWERFPGTVREVLEALLSSPGGLPAVQQATRALEALEHHLQGDSPVHPLF